MVKKNPLMSTQKIAEHSRIFTITKNKEAILIRSGDFCPVNGTYLLYHEISIQVVHNFVKMQCNRASTIF